MKIENINPFVEGVYELFETMLNSELTRKGVAVSREPSKFREVTALIGMSGPVRGTVALAFPVDTAIALVNRLLDTDIKVMDDSIADGIAELVNMVAGSAKAKFPIPDGVDPVNLTLPTVVRGLHYEVNYPAGSIWLEVPFDSDLGEFNLRVTFSQ